MLDPVFVRDHPDEVRRGLHKRGMNVDGDLEAFATLENRRRRLIPELEGLKREQNAAGDEIARAKRQGKDASAIFEANRQRAQQIRQLGIELDQVEHQRTMLLMSLPNLPHESVPVGKTDADNQVVRTWGETKKFDFEPVAHWDLGPALGILDFDRAGFGFCGRGTPAAAGRAGSEESCTRTCTSPEEGRAGGARSAE